MKNLLLLFLMMFSLTVQSFAQKTKTDSASLKTAIAMADAKHFKVTKQAWKAYKNHQVIFSSDYFKPTTINTTHPELLTDSTYVKAFREAAHKKITKRRTVGHYILKGYLAGIIVYAIVVFIQLATGSLKFLD